MDERLRRAIEHAAGARGAMRWQRVGATGWGDAWSLAAGGRRHFVKLARGGAAMLEAEADGLRAIADTRTVRVPQPIAVGAEGGHGYLVVEWLDLAAREGGAALGAALARMHAAKAPCGAGERRFGWHRDNFIGATPQANGWCDDWPSFFVERRLAPQLALAARNGFGAVPGGSGERLLAKARSLLRGHEATASLVHGDLWSGNAGMLGDGTPVVFDPAVYVGDREVDVAMTELFGGFDAAFRRAYEAAWPLRDGYARRRVLYDCYHLLNHVNLFGAGYLASARATIALALAEAD